MVAVGSSLSGITKRFSRKGPWVLNGIDLDLKSGSRTLIIGGNGSGKSTLLRNWGGSQRAERWRRQAARQHWLRTGATGRPDKVHRNGVPGPHGPDQGAHCRRDRRSKSGATRTLRPQTQPERGHRLIVKRQPKLVIAQAFLGPVELLVLDEPFSGLDPVAHAALGELTSEAQSGGTAVLISSHHVFPEQVAQRQLRIHSGQLTEIGHDETPGAPSAGVVEVELVPTERALDRIQIASLPGVSHARLGQPQGILVLFTDRLQIDGVLTAAIAHGWSVRSVSPESREGHPE